MNEDTGNATVSPHGDKAAKPDKTPSAIFISPDLFGIYKSAPFVRQILIVGCAVFPLFLIYPFALRASATGGAVPVAAVALALVFSAVGVFCVMRFFRTPSLQVTEAGLLYRSATKAHQFSWEDVAQAHIPYDGYDLTGMNQLKLKLPNRDGKRVEIPFQSFPRALPVFGEIAGHVPFEPKPEVRSDMRIVLPVPGRGKTAIHLTPSGVVIGDGTRAERVPWAEVDRIELVDFCRGIPAFEMLIIDLAGYEIRLLNHTVGGQTDRNWSGGLPAQLIRASLEHLAPADKIAHYCLVGPSPLPVPPEIKNAWATQRRKKASRAFMGFLLLLLCGIALFYTMQVVRLRASEATPSLLTYILLGASFLYFVGFATWQLSIAWRRTMELIRLVEHSPSN